MSRIILLLLLFQSAALAQWIDAAYLTTGPLYLPFNRQGILADVNIGPQNNTMQWDNTTIVFSAGFYITGISNDKKFIGGMASANVFESYSKGKVDNQGDSRNKIYSVKKSDPEFGESWIAWKDAVWNGAYYYDGDGNGEYEPLDHNQNGQWDLDEDRPDLLYDQTYYTVFNDEWVQPPRIFDPIYHRRSIEVRQTIFTNSSQYKDQTIFIKYSIVNRGLVADTLKDVVLSIWVDPDIGYHEDDLIGCDTTLNSAFTYNNGPDSLFGEHPPALFYTFLQGPQIDTGNPQDTSFNRFGSLIGIDKKAGFRNGKLGSHTSQGIPECWFLGCPQHESIWTLARGNTMYSTPFDVCSDTVHGELIDLDCEDVDNRYWFSGDPVKQTGWINIDPRDQRQLVNTESFELVKDVPQDIIIAYTAARGYNKIHSFSVAREIVKMITDDYKNNFPDSYTTPAVIEDLPYEYSLLQNYPNPFNPTTTIKFTLPNHPSPYQGEGPRVRLVVYDILGRKVKTLVNEVKSPGNYEVQFDASQLASGVYFYRLTCGSFVQTKKMMVIK